MLLRIKAHIRYQIMQNPQFTQSNRNIIPNMVKLYLLNLGTSKHQEKTTIGYHKYMHREST